MTEGLRPARPVRVADIESSAHASSGDAAEPLELAYATAAKVVAAGRGEGASPDMVTLAETVGLDTLAQLWRRAPADSLPGALWSLYLLRAWCTDHGEEVAHLYRAGRSLAPVDEVVAGAHDDADPAAMAELADVVLRGVYRGDLAVALERAASFFRVIAERRLMRLGDDRRDEAEQKRAMRNRSCAQALARAARSWRAGTLGGV